MTIEELAARVGCKTTDIRYYERLGLLPERYKKSIYTYDERHELRLQMIIKASTLGFTMDEIRMMIAMRKSSDQYGQY